MKTGNLSEFSFSRSSSSGSIVNDGGPYEQEEPSIQNSDAMEKILLRKSLQLRNRQQHWQVILFLPLATVILAGRSTLLHFIIYFIYM